MARIDPTQLPDLPVPFMNADHEREAALVNQLEAAVAAHARGTGTLAEVVERLSLLAVHTRDHFLREETMMREAGFPAYAVHKAEHDRVLAEMDAEARIFREHGDAGRLSRYLFEALPAWFENHVRTMDVVTARFVAARDGATRQKL
ncbi:MAG TPA: hemerythrin family protein [Anaeromyxobacter sp.]